MLFQLLNLSHPGVTLRLSHHCSHAPSEFTRPLREYYSSESASRSRRGGEGRYILLQKKDKKKSTLRCLKPLIFEVRNLCAATGRLNEAHAISHFRRLVFGKKFGFGLLLLPFLVSCKVSTLVSSLTCLEVLNLLLSSWKTPLLNSIF